MLIDRWRATWDRLHSPPPPHLFETIIAAHAEPQRSYHTAQHLEECFLLLDGSPTPPTDPASFELAIWFHDAVYDPRRQDNEDESAALARRHLQSLGADLTERVVRLIAATQHVHPPETADEQLLTDIDLGILGAEPERFEEYERQIRSEYEWVPAPQYREARLAVLRRFLDRTPLYSTEHFQRELESRARQNLARSIEQLAS